MAAEKNTAAAAAAKLTHMYAKIQSQNIVVA